MPADQWIEQAREHLSSLTPDLQGQVLRQQAALALMQAQRDGAASKQLETVLQGCVLQQLQQAVKELGR